MKRLAWLIATGTLFLLGCSHELKAKKQPTVNNANLTYCNADQTFVVTGTGLSPMIIEGATKKPTLDMPDVCLTRVSDIDGNPVMPPEMAHCLKETDVEWVSQSELRFVLHPDYSLSPGNYDVTINDPDGFQLTGTVHVKVLPGEVVVFWSDPNVVYNGITTQATVYGTNLGDVTEVDIRNEQLMETKVDSKPVGMHQNRVQVTIPSGTPVATYDVVVHTSTGCIAELKRGMQVTATLDDKLVSSIDPTFGFTQEATPVTIVGNGFLPVPRAYLNPHNPMPDTVATALSSVALKSDTGMTGVVPKSLPPGAYDLIVVNPDGHVGVLNKLPGSTSANGAFFVTTEAPPVVANISPLYLDNDAAHTATVEGTGFNNPTVTLSCQKPDGTTAELMGTVAAGATSTSFDVSLPVGGLPGGTVCIVTVTNADNSYYKYSAIGVSIPASNLNPMIDAPAMATKRRAPAVSAGRATRSARFLYAIGGDDGSAAGAFSSVESSPIDVYGANGNWFNQPVQLPGKRTLAGIARIGRFLYVVGGNDGTAPTTSVLRAQVLDPLAAPQIVDVGARRDKTSAQGIGAGIWYYRVSAVMADNDAANPGGETLASDPIAVSLSAETVANGTLILRLYWDAVPNAKGYRVYRNPNGTENVDGVRRVADINDPAAKDYEGIAPAGQVTGDPPLPLGATGVWAAMPALGTAREAAGVTAAQDPSNPNQWYVIALGGRSPAGLATWERLPVTVDPATGAQTPATWTAGGQNLSAARSELTAYAVSHVEAVQVPKGTTYIYAGGGEGSTNVDVAALAAGGELAWAATRPMTPGRTGYTGIAGAGFLFAFGGARPNGTDDSMAAGEINATAPPQLVNWNNNGGARLVHPRSLAGGTVESAFIYIVGGLSSGAPTAAVERTVL